MRYFSMKLPGLLFVQASIILTVVFFVSVAAGAIEFDGLIEPHRVINIGGSGGPGILETVEVDRGDFVKKGQVLAKLQSGVEKAAMEVARGRAEMEADVKAKEANRDFLSRKHGRSDELFQKDFVPFSDKDEAETNKKLAEAQLQEVLENKRLNRLEYERTSEVVKRMTIRSPVNGVVVERFLSPGEYVETQPILKLAEIDPLNVELIIPVKFFPAIKVGMRASVKPEAPVGGQYIAEVKIVDRVIDAASSTFGVRLELPNPSYRLPAGLKCKVIFPDK
jgi:RND family efflux transporter MFP subunit